MVDPLPSRTIPCEDSHVARMGKFQEDRNRLKGVTRGLRLVVSPSTGTRMVGVIAAALYDYGEE